MQIDLNGYFRIQNLFVRPLPPFWMMSPHLPGAKKKIEIDTILQLAEQKFDAAVSLILKK